MMAKDEKRVTFQDKLNNLAKNLMDQVPNDIRDKADNFIKEIAKAVTSEIAEIRKEVSAAEARAGAAEKRISEGKEGDLDVTEEKFILREVTSAEGTWPSLYRLSDSQNKALFCINPKKGQPDICGAHCAGFKVLADGNVELCNGSVRQIER